MKESHLLQMNTQQAELESRVLERNCMRTSENLQRTMSSYCVTIVSQLSSEKAQPEGNKTVLADEIQDLKLCLKSVDRELVEVKTVLRQETEKAKNKSAELYLRNGKLEQQMSAKTAERERALEELQVLQQHCVEEKEEELCEEKPVMRATETEQESREAALRREVGEKGIQLAEETTKNEELSSELEEVQYCTSKAVQHSGYSLE